SSVTLYLYSFPTRRSSDLTSVVASVIFSTCFSVAGVPHVTRTLRDKVPISNIPLHLILKKPFSGKIRKSVSRKMKNVKHAMVREQNPVQKQKHVHIVMGQVS